MAKDTKGKSAATAGRPAARRAAVDPELARLRRRRVVVHVTIGLLLLGGVGAGGYAAWRYVVRQVAFPAKPLQVMFTNQPAWMTERLAREIGQSTRPKGAHSAFDHNMLVEIDRALRKNPWVRKVRSVRRAYGRGPADTIEIDCDFRAPAALVRWQDDFHYVDGQGVLLPERFEVADLDRLTVGADGRAIFRVVEGVRRAPPRRPGYKWAGEGNPIAADLAAGLKMAQYIAGKPYTEEIRVINVENFGGRVDKDEAELVLVTKYGTKVHWGLPPGDEDEGILEVRAERKLAYLQTLYEKFGRVDMNQPWVRVRFDKVTYPVGDARAGDGGKAAHANVGRE